MTPGAGGRTGVLRVPSQLIVDRLPGLLTDTAVIAALLADLLVEHVQVNWNKHIGLDKWGGKGGDLLCLKPSIGGLSIGVFLSSINLQKIIKKKKLHTFRTLFKKRLISFVYFAK